MRAEAPRFVLIGLGANPSEPKTMRVPFDGEAIATSKGWYVIVRESDILTPQTTDGATTDPA